MLCTFLEKIWNATTKVLAEIFCEYRIIDCFNFLLYTSLIFYTFMVGPYLFGSQSEHRSYFLLIGILSYFLLQWGSSIAYILSDCGLILNLCILVFPPFKKKYSLKIICFVDLWTHKIMQYWGLDTVVARLIVTPKTNNR